MGSLTWKIRHKFSAQHPPYEKQNRSSWKSRAKRRRSQQNIEWNYPASHEILDKAIPTSSPRNDFPESFTRALCTGLSRSQWRSSSCSLSRLALMNSLRRVTPTKLNSTLEIGSAYFRMTQQIYYDDNTDLFLKGSPWLENWNRSNFWKLPNRIVDNEKNFCTGSFLRNNIRQSSYL